METPANRKRQKQTQRERDRHTERVRQKSKSETETERLREKQRETERNKVGYRGNNTHTHVHTHARNNTDTHILVSINKIIPFWLEIKQFGGKETKHSHTFPHTFCNKIKITSNQIIRLFENKRNHIHNLSLIHI